MMLCNRNEKQPSTHDGNRTCMDKYIIYSKFMLKVFHNYFCLVSVCVCVSFSPCVSKFMLFKNVTAVHNLSNV